MDIKLFLVILAVVAIIFLYIKKGKEIIPSLSLAFFISLAWTSFYPYDYVGVDDYFIFGLINLYPLILWTVLLVALREVYIKIKINPFMKFFGITIAYWVTLFFLEALGYYVLGIRLATSYPSFLGSGVLHLPLYGQLFYLTIGPIYLLVTNYLEETNQLINKMFYEKSNL